MFLNFQVVNLGCNEGSTHTFAVRGGLVLEVCLARWWSSLVDGQVEVNVEFHSLRPSLEEVCWGVSELMYTYSNQTFKEGCSHVMKLVPRLARY